jgi:hypothetical protein
VGASLYVLVLALHEEGPCIGLEAQLPANPLGLVRELLRLVRFDVALVSKMPSRLGLVDAKLLAVLAERPS